MLILTKENLIPYLRQHYPSLDLSGPVTLSAIGDPDGVLPADGLVNYIFRVKTNTQSVIVKQGRDCLRIDENRPLPPQRNRLEYETLKMRGVLVPQYVPQIYYIDFENHVFLMEDVSYLPSSGQQFCQGILIPDFGRRCAEYIATTVFYGSEFYLETEQFRALSNTFTNTAMREIMETWLFLRVHKFPPNPLCADLNKYIDGDPDLVSAGYALRHKFMTQNEALIHGDLHTANIFADGTNMKVIDMEYTFAGPLCYDVGYLLNTFVSQYCSAIFRPFPTPLDRMAFKTYLLETIQELYQNFVGYFTQYWREDAKPVYRNQDGFRQLITDGFLSDVVGYASMPGLCRVMSEQGYTELSLIPDQEDRRNALQLFLVLERHLLLTRHRYRSIEDVTAEIMRVEETFLRTQ